MCVCVHEAPIRIEGLHVELIYFLDLFIRVFIYLIGLFHITGDNSTAQSTVDRWSLAEIRREYDESLTLSRVDRIARPVRLARPRKHGHGRATTGRRAAPQARCENVKAREMPAQSRTSPRENGSCRSCLDGMSFPCCVRAGKAGCSWDRLINTWITRTFALPGHGVAENASHYL